MNLHLTFQPPLALFLAVMSLLVGLADGQEKAIPATGTGKAKQVPEAAAKSDSATLRGKIVVPPQHASYIKPDELLLKLSEQVQVEDPPLPENFNELDPDKQMAWWKDFQQSEAGKAFVAAQEERFRNRRVFDVRVEPNGEFVAFDVPRGIWDIRGGVTRQAGTYEVLYEIFGELMVEAGVQEIALGDMEISATTMLKAGDVVPVIKVAGKNGKVDLEAARGKFCLVTFWSASEPSSSFFQKTVQTATKELSAQHPLMLCSIGLNQDAEAARAFFAEHGELGVYAESKWDDELADQLGVRSIPWLMLLDRDGKVLASDRDLGTALRTSGLDLKNVLLHRIEGRELPVITPPSAPSGEAPKTSPDKQE